MNSEVVQDVLFQDPIGMRLRRGREQAGLTIEQVGQQLRLPVAIVQAMELDDWARLGAPVYVRSYLGSYLRLVGLPAALAEPAARSNPAPALVGAVHNGTSVQLTISGTVGKTYHVVRTGDLTIPTANWTVLTGTATIGSGGTATFTDSVPLAGAAFYRVRDP